MFKSRRKHSFDSTERKQVPLSYYYKQCASFSFCFILDFGVSAASLLLRPLKRWVASFAKELRLLRPLSGLA